MGHTPSSICVCAAAERAGGRQLRCPMVRQGQHAEPRAPRRVARDRRGCAGHAAIRKRANHRRLLAFPTEEQLFGIPVRQGLLTAETAILGRRSAVAMDGSTAISQEAFFRMLARLIPTRDGRAMPWDAIPWRPRIHLGLFVHRVEGVPRGLYALAAIPTSSRHSRK